MQSIDNNPYLQLGAEVYGLIVNGKYSKPGRSPEGSADCVMVTLGPNGLIGVQDSKLDDAARKERTLIFRPSEMAAFILSVKDGDYDYLIDRVMLSAVEAPTATPTGAAAQPSRDDRNGRGASARLGGSATTSAS